MSDRIIDNRSDRNVASYLKGILKTCAEVKVAIGYFYLNGFELVKEDFPVNPRKGFLKIVMGRETSRDTADEIISGYTDRFTQEERERLMTQDLEGKTSDQVIAGLKTLRDYIREGIIEFKFYEREIVHAKLYVLIQNPERRGTPSPFGVALLGSSNFTYPGLMTNKELNYSISDAHEVAYLEQWFDKLYAESVDYSENILRVLENSHHVNKDRPAIKLGKYLPPEAMFRYLIYRYFDGRVTMISDKDVLAEFQLIGMINAIKMADFYNGAIIADSVGMGKSFIGMGILQEFVRRKISGWLTSSSEIPSVLMLLPPSVIGQWEDLITGDLDSADRDALEVGHTIPSQALFLAEFEISLAPKPKRNDKTYILSRSGIKAAEIRLYSVGLLQYAAPKDLEIWRNQYQLILIDEAHKFRSATSQRWEMLRQLRKRSSGHFNKFLMLTATPVNNSVADLYNLIKLFNDDTFQPFLMKNVNVSRLFTDYRDKKRKLDANPDDKKNQEAVRKAASAIQAKVVEETVLLRTRKYIQEHYKNIKIQGRPLVFRDPEPHAVDYSEFFDGQGRAFITGLAAQLDELRFEHTRLYGAQMLAFAEDHFGGGKEKASSRFVPLADIFRLMLGKRLESGFFPFEISLRKIFAREQNFYQVFVVKLDKIRNEDDLRKHLESVLEKVGILQRTEDSEDLFQDQSVDDENGLSENWFEHTLQMLLGEDYGDGNLQLGLRKAQKFLEQDLSVFKEIISTLDLMKESGNVGHLPKSEEGQNFGIYTYKRDPKLEALKNLLGQPSTMSRALTAPNLYAKKTIIFTQYKDTAYYLHHHLEQWIKSEASVIHAYTDERNRGKIALVTGETDALTRSNVKKRFAPDANRGHDEAKARGELTLLIATDAFSEGVNLQDGDAVVNFDLPWNPMIIVQRVGRINRIGNDKDVLVHNFFPSVELTPMVSVIRKLQEKIKDVTLILGKESRILEADEEVNEKSFGQRIKTLAQMRLADLEISALPQEMSESKAEASHQEEFQLLSTVQYDLGYSRRDFTEFESGGFAWKQQYYTFISGENRLYSVYELRRGVAGEDKMLRKVVLTTTLEGYEVREESPLVLLNLVKENQKQPRSGPVSEIKAALARMQQHMERKMEEVAAGGSIDAGGFLVKLSEFLLREFDLRYAKTDREPVFNSTYNALRALSSASYSARLKQWLEDRNLLLHQGNIVALKDAEKGLDAIAEFLAQREIQEINYEQRVVPYGWYYESTTS